jgi:hypothetical protein
MCPVNGIRDLVQWRTGRNWSNEFVHGLGLGGGFTYLRFGQADPPRQVYWGNAGPRQHNYLANLLEADFVEKENRTFKFTWRQAQEAVDNETPPILGPMDMFFLPFYKDIYCQRHIPIHYLLLVGYDEENAYVHDTDKDDVQALGIDALQRAWDVNVPGLGKRNRYVILDIPQDLPPTEALIRKSIADECQTMLHPPVSMVGIPAMKKIAREIVGWPEELGAQAAATCLRQVREYLNSPPDIQGDHLTAGRDLYITYLMQAGDEARLDFSKPIDFLKETIATVPQLDEALRQRDLEQATACFERIAEAEYQAYSVLSENVGL